MKICIYSENLKLIAKSGIGRATEHQIKMCQLQNIPYTLNYRDNYDILLINTYGIMSKKVITSAQKQGAKIIYLAHSNKEDFLNSFRFSNFIANYFKKWLIHHYTLADQIIVPTEYAKNILLKYGIKVPINTISNGIDTNKIVKNLQNIENFKKYFAITKQDKIIVGGGLLIKRKGLLDFIQLAKNLPHYKFIWFGQTHSLIRQRKINKALKEAKSIDNLIFPGYVKGNIFQGALAGADVAFFPTYEETESIILLEAFANEQTCIIRDISVFNDWTENKKNCYKANNIKNFEIIIKKIIQSKLPKLPKAARIVAKNKDLKIVAAKWMTILKKLNKP